MFSSNRLKQAIDRADKFALMASALAISFSVLRIHRKLFPHYSGWFAGFDQTRYLVAAQAWAHGKFDPALHHYPPGYSLAAAPFVYLFPAQPFAIPDLIFWLLSLYFFVETANYLTPPRPGWRTASAAAFCVATLGTPTLRQIWVIPWNTTGSTPFEYAALFATIQFCELRSGKWAAMAGAALGALAGIRPTDAAILATCCAAYALVRMRGQGAARLLTLAAISLAALLAAILPFAAAHVLVNGFSPGFYVAKSAGVGFEWRLLPLRWITLVIDPRPLLPTGLGLAEGLPWLLPGIAGVLMLLRRSEPRDRVWWLISCAIAAQWMLYLAYRDLQPYGLWRFYNLHYFKWTFPFLLLAALRLLHAFAAPKWRMQAVVASAVTGALALWQPIGIVNARQEVKAGSGSLPLPSALSRLDREIYLPMTGSWEHLYFGRATVTAGASEFRNTRDFKLQPVAGGVLLQTLRPLPREPLIFTPSTDTGVGAGTMLTLKEELRFGLPCGLLSSRPACQPIHY